MRVLVSGGAGYIGSHVALALEDAGHSVLVFDRHDPRPGLFGPAVGAMRGDIRDRAALDQAFASGPFDGVIHLAGLKSVAESIDNPAAYFDVNVAGSLRLLEAMQRAGVRLLVFSSSCAVYGTPDRLPITEGAALHPENPYGESKLLVERMLPWFDRAAGIRALSLRYFNAAGAMPDASNGEDWRGAVNLIPVVIEATLGHRAPVDVFGFDYPTPDGSAIRDYIHVLDLADAHVVALERLVAGAPSGPVNLGTGRGVSVLEILGSVAAAAGRPVPHRLMPRRAGDPAAVWADCNRSQALLGWEARRGLDSIIGSALAWHRRGKPGP